jgi:hypothetical protein
MLHIDIPSLEQFKPLAQVKRETCISTYVHTSRLGTDDKLNRLAFKNLAKEALSRLREGGADRAKMAAFESQPDSLAGPERDIQDEDKIRKLQRAGRIVLALSIPWPRGARHHLPPSSAMNFTDHEAIGEE